MGDNHDSRSTLDTWTMAEIESQKPMFNFNEIIFLARTPLEYQSMPVLKLAASSFLFSFHGTQHACIVSIPGGFHAGKVCEVAAGQI